MAKKLSPAVESALSVIAHDLMARGLAKDVAGFQGFADFYRKRLSAKDRALIDRFEEISRNAYRDLAKGMEKPDGQ